MIVAPLVGLWTAMATASAPSIVAVDVVDVLPVATVAVAVSFVDVERATASPGPCGPRRLVVLWRTDVEGFLRDPASVPSLPRTLPPPPPDDDVPAFVLPLVLGPGIFAGEAEVMAAAVDEALAQAKLLSMAPTTLRWRNGQPSLRLGLDQRLSKDAVEAALRAFIPTSAWLSSTTARVAQARRLAERTPGTRALEAVDARLCLGPRAGASTTPLSPAVVRAALSAPVLFMSSSSSTGGDRP
jgi:hypothetical protein